MILDRPRPRYGDTHDEEGFRICTALHTIPTDGTWAAIHMPGRIYATSVSVRICPERPGHIEVTRDGKGDILHVEAATARRRMAPVRIGLPPRRTVAFFGLPAEGPAEVSWGLAWTLKTGEPATYFEHQLDALIALAHRYII
jgi:hypothetical protein